MRPGWNVEKFMYDMNMFIITLEYDTNDTVK